jgi:hypothetical protein
MAKTEFIQPHPTEEDDSDFDIEEPYDDETTSDFIIGDPPTQKQKVKFPTAFPGKRIDENNDPRNKGIREF